MPIGFLVRFGNRSSLALAFLDLFERLATSDVLTHWLRRFGFACKRSQSFVVRDPGSIFGRGRGTGARDNYRPPARRNC
jgi:hypothetical protein